MDTFWFTEVNFGPIPTYEGSFSISDTVFVHSHGFSESSDGKKPVSVKCVVKKDRERTLTSELSQGSLGTKITLKRSLEAVISTSFARIGRGVSRRCSQSPHLTPNDKYWPRNGQIVTQSRFQKSKISDDFFGVIDPMSHLRYAFQQWPRFLPHNFPEMFRKLFLKWSRPFCVCVDGYWGRTFLVIIPQTIPQTSYG